MGEGSQLHYWLLLGLELFVAIGVLIIGIMVILQALKIRFIKEQLIRELTWTKDVIRGNTTAIDKLTTAVEKLPSAVAHSIRRELKP